MIKSVNFSLFSSKNLLTFAQRVLRIFNSIASENEVINSLFVKVKAAYDNFSSAFERDTKSAYTEILDSKDTIRDEAFLALRCYLEACSHRAAEGWNEAANKILDIIRKHGWSTQLLSYKTETASIDNILNETNNKCSKEVILLSASEWFSELATTQADFEGVRDDSVTDTSDDGPTIKETRPTLQQTLRDLMNMTDLLYKSSGEEAMLISINALNELITLTMSTARASATRSENQKAEDVPEDTTTENNTNA